MSQVIPFPARTIQPGSFTQVVNVPDGFDHANIQLDRTNFTNTAVELDLAIDFSLDDGATWLIGMQMTDHGGVFLRLGQPITKMGVFTDIPAGTNRKARLRLDVRGGAAVLGAGTLTLLP